jgi:hypothetical protein
LDDQRFSSSASISRSKTEDRESLRSVAEKRC